MTDTTTAAGAQQSDDAARTPTLLAGASYRF